MRFLWGAVRRMMMVMIMMIVVVIVRMIGVGADALDMVMMAGLRRAEIILIADDLHTIFA